MGSSFTRFRGNGFWSRDALLEAWLRVLALHLEEEAYRPGWQHELRDNWLLASAGYFSGSISASLDDLLTDGERIAVALRASERSLNSLRAFGDYVPAAFLNGLGLKPFGADLPLAWFERIAECFNRLLRGSLRRMRRPVLCCQWPGWARAGTKLNNREMPIRPRHRVAAPG